MWDGLMEFLGSQLEKEWETDGYNIDNILLPTYGSAFAFLAYQNTAFYSWQKNQTWSWSVYVKLWIYVIYKIMKNVNSITKYDKQIFRLWEMV